MSNLAAVVAIVMLERWPVFELRKDHTVLGRRTIARQRHSNLLYVLLCQDAH